MTADDPLPEDVETLKAMLLAERSARRTAEAQAHERALQIEKLKHTIAKLRHERFGQSAERRALLDQLELQLVELDEDQAQSETAAEAAVETTVTVQPFQRRKPARRPLPDHLTRERVVYPGPSACPCCGGGLRKLGEDVTETLELVPRQWKVIQHVREKYSCRACETIAQPPAPSHPIARGRAGPGLLAHVLFAKYGLHLPLTRQSDTYAREGVELDVSTLADWVGASAATLMPLVEAIRDHVFAAERIHADDTTVPVLDTGRTRTGRLWAYVRDDRPFAGADPPAAVYFYSPDRGGAHPEGHLASYVGLMQADAFAGFNRLYEAGRKPGPIIEAACWAHARRKFFDLARLNKACWDGLVRFLDDGRLCMTNNAAERALRCVAVGRHNWTFAGSDAGARRAAAIYTLVETAKLNNVDPQAWLADMLARLQDHPAKRLTELMPWNWKLLQQQRVAA